MKTSPKSASNPLSECKTGFGQSISWISLDIRGAEDFTGCLTPTLCFTDEN